MERFSWESFGQHNGNIGNGFPFSWRSFGQLDMSINQEDPMAYQRSILLCFNAGKTLEEAYEIVCRSFPCATLDGVKSWYTRFEANNTNLRVPLPFQENPKTLTDLPAEILGHITDDITARDMKALKKTCKATHVKVQTERVYTKVQLHLKLASVVLLTSGKEVVNQRQTYSERKRDLDDKEEGTSQGASEHVFITKAVEQFGNVINQPRVKIEELTITVDQSERARIEEKRKLFFQKLEGTMDGLKTSLHVEKFTIDVETPMILQKFLETLKPGALSDIRVSRFPITPAVFDMSGIVALPHWPHLTRFNSSSTLEISIESFGNMQSVIAHIVKATTDEVVNYKNRIIANIEKKMSTHNLILFDQRCDPSDICEKLEPYEETGVEGFEGFIQCANNIRLRFDVNSYQVLFFCDL